MRCAEATGGPTKAQSYQVEHEEENESGLGSRRRAVAENHAWVLDHLFTKWLQVGRHCDAMRAQNLLQLHACTVDMRCCMNCGIMCISYVCATTFWGPFLARKICARKHDSTVRAVQYPRACCMPFDSARQDAPGMGQVVLLGACSEWGWHGLSVQVLVFRHILHHSTRTVLFHATQVAALDSACKVTPGMSEEARARLLGAWHGWAASTNQCQTACWRCEKRIWRNR